MQRSQKVLCSTTHTEMPDPRAMNAWMGHCGGTDPYCQQGCSPECVNYTYMTGIETVGACKDSSADTLVEKFGNRGDTRPPVGQRAVQEAMRKVQEGHARGAHSTLPQHQGRFEGGTSATFETSGLGSTSITASSSSVATASDGKQYFNSINLSRQNMTSLTPRTAPKDVVEDEDEDAEYEVEEPQRRCWTGAPRRPPGPVQRRGSWEPPN
jgi:hypothetical protein